MRPLHLPPLLALLWFSAAVTSQTCTDCTNESHEPILSAPAPWTLKGTIYSFFLLPILGIPLNGQLPLKAFPPLERQSPASIAGDYQGTIGMMQILRYTESPVGPYDEFLIVPGFFRYPGPNPQETLSALRVSRIYVSQKYTAYNGRANWNIPKHLARFDWTSSVDGNSESVKIYPFDTNPNDPTESTPSTKPFFQTTFSPLPLVGSLLPGIPFSTDLYAYLGINATLVQPPLNANPNDAFGAMVGTSTAKSVVPGQFSAQTSLGTFDMDQSGGEGEAEGRNAVGDEFYRNFWPGLLRVTPGLKMVESTITFSEAREWVV